MSKSCKPLHPGLFLLGAATAALVFAAPQTCAEAFRQGLALCGGPLLVSLFPFLVVSALIMRSGAGEVLGVRLAKGRFTVYGSGLRICTLTAARLTVQGQFLRTDFSDE